MREKERDGGKGEQKLRASLFLMSSGPTFLSAGRPLRERHELPTPAFGCPRGEPAPPESSAAPAGRSPCGGGRAREKGPGRATQEHALRTGPTYEGRKKGGKVCRMRGRSCSGGAVGGPKKTAQALTRRAQRRVRFNRERLAEEEAQEREGVWARAAASDSAPPLLPAARGRRREAPGGEARSLVAARGLRRRGPSRTERRSKIDHHELGEGCGKISFGKGITARVRGAGGARRSCRGVRAEVRGERDGGDATACAAPKSARRCPGSRQVVAIGPSIPSAPNLKHKIFQLVHLLGVAARVPQLAATLVMALCAIAGPLASRGRRPGAHALLLGAGVFLATVLTTTAATTGVLLITAAPDLCTALLPAAAVVHGACVARAWRVGPLALAFALSPLPGRRRSGVRALSDPIRALRRHAVGIADLQDRADGVVVATTVS
ncbi:unnamed protein product [Prorocentrum cordatum]|uniref:Uncharacterized protein n=1 Tax=Prorocentrum cordatum TaxID=2364126 RepID=A0ABN9WBJ0_9DINO|nr:unnamed protein product [Polarella glacialis]